MADKAIVNSKISAKDAAQAVTLTAADVTTDGTTGVQKFVYTPTGKDSKIVLVYTNSTMTDGMTCTVTAGVMATGRSANTLTLSGTAGTYAIQFDTGRYMLANGTIEFTFAPVNSGKDLTNDAALKVGVIELI